jgi:endonuclease YncB( thermonuclease family)
MASDRVSIRSTSPASARVVCVTYQDLLRQVRAVLFTGRQKIEDAWLMMFHDIGRLIHEHVLLQEERADLGARVFIRLAADTGVSKRVLYEWVQFFRCFPVVRLTAQLTRTHYQLLCQVGDPKQRMALTTQASKNKWTTPELRVRVRSLNAALADPAGAEDAKGITDGRAAIELFTPKRGVAGLYRVVARKRGLAVDVGFKVYFPLTTAQAGEFAAGDIVRVEGGQLTAVETAKSANLFTYRALDYRVIDGDTLTLDIELPRSEMVEKMRLRGIDCPEMNTAEGRAAKRFVERMMVDAEEITVVTSKVDKYDRYLADVYLRLRSGEEVYLNNALLAAGHAVRMDASSQGDWTP